ncbi:hypothetical protein [Acinetobacter junii]|uniref:hypothetical protein n=1 Tax=Acinetobacter junii TaxID=40215 RepID=UPI001FB1A89C|nr:hypothetical protein [Acinetobacter junii]UOB51286.1 hypothetical protein MRY16_09055 [Acinetobacter junii]
MNAKVKEEKLSNIEWLGQYLRAKTPNYEQTVSGGSNDTVAAWEIRCSAFASIETDLAKALAALYVWGHKDKEAYMFVQIHLAKIVVKEAESKGQKPNVISLESLAKLMARLVIDFEIEPTLNDVFTSKGRLYYAGISTHQMTYDAYRKTWKDYESLMDLAIVSARWEIDTAISKYRKQLIA